MSYSEHWHHVCFLLLNDSLKVFKTLPHMPPVFILRASKVFKMSKKQMPSLISFIVKMLLHYLCNHVNSKDVNSISNLLTMLISSDTCHVLAPDLQLFQNPATVFFGL